MLKNLTMQPFVKYPKLIFLLDAIGAVLTAFFIGIILVKLQTYIAMPKRVLYVLAGVALILCAYSSCCFVFLKNNIRPFLKVLIVANLLYCCLTLGLLFFYFAKLTALAYLYFITEILIIIAVVLLERKVYKNLILNN